jgi:hypothetical protein
MNIDLHLLSGNRKLPKPIMSPPSKLEYNHPDLTKEMIQAWTTAFPETTIHCSVQSPPVEPVDI